MMSTKGTKKLTSTFHPCCFLTPCCSGISWTSLFYLIALVSCILSGLYVLSTSSFVALTTFLQPQTPSNVTPPTRPSTGSVSSASDRSSSLQRPFAPSPSIPPPLPDSAPISQPLSPWCPLDSPQAVHLTCELPPTQANKFVTIAREILDGRGLGNQLFMLGAVLYVASLTGRQPALEEKMFYLLDVNNAFDLTTSFERVRFEHLCPCLDFMQSNLEYVGEPARAYPMQHFMPYKELRTVRALVLRGYWQGWRFTRASPRLRHFFTFRAAVQRCAETFLRLNVPPMWTYAGFVRVAVHARRGDLLTQKRMENGYTVPNATYFHRAMEHFASRYGRVQFVVASDDMPWARKNIVAPVGLPRELVNVTYVPRGHTPGEDLAILALCDHTIVSTGTFGWWAAWLARGAVVYYKDWPREGTWLAEGFVSNDYFEPAWIGM